MSLLDQLETEIAQRLESLPFFANITVHADPQKNIVAEIETKIAKLKTLIAPLVSAADDNNPSMGSGVYFDDIQITVGVFQHPLLKGSDPTPRTICEAIHAGLKGWTPASLNSPIVPTKPGIQQIADRTLNIWNTNFQTKGGLVSELPKIYAVESSVTGGNVTLTCDTAGAAIFFTTDNSTPSPRNGTLYTAAFASSGETVKARAFLAGYLHSDVLKLTT